MSIPDYDHQACRTAKVLGSRLVRAALHNDTMLYGQVEFAQWSVATPDRFERQHWYEVRFEPLGTRREDIWSSKPPNSDAHTNRLHFSVQERTAAHPEGAGSVAKLGPIGHIRTEPKSAGLGTYLRDQLIDWVARLHPDASVAQGSLSWVDGKADNLERRNRFYVGGKFQIRVHEDGSGAFWADRLDGLQRHTEKGNVVELAKDEMRRLLQNVSELERARQEVEALRRESARLRAETTKAQALSFWFKVGGTVMLVALLIATAKGRVSWHLF